MGGFSVSDFTLGLLVSQRKGIEKLVPIPGDNHSIGAGRRKILKHVNALAHYVNPFPEFIFRTTGS